MKEIELRNTQIISFYKSKQYTTEKIAGEFGITTRQVQRIVKAAGVVRTIAESNRAMAPLKDYKKLPEHLKKKRKTVPLKLRYKLLSEAIGCAVCGDDNLLQIDHIDEDPTNNEENNLQVLCRDCNVGKSHLNRYA